MRLALKTLVVLGCLIVAVTTVARPVSATSGPWARNDLAAVRLVAAIDGVGDRATVPLGLHFKLRPGWKIYWRSPGDAGYPPRSDWRQSTNVDSVTVHWPAPTRFSIFDLETLGYTDEVVLPLTAKLSTPGAPAAIAASVDYLICKEVCVPQSAQLKLQLPQGPARLSAMARLINRYSDRVPDASGRHGLVIEKVALATAGDGFSLRVKVRAADPFVAPDLFVEGPEGSYFGRPRVRLTAGGLSADLTIEGGGTDPVAGESVPLTLTLVDGGRMAEKAVLASYSRGDEHPLPDQDPAEATSYATILLLALLGGLILNLMPCVLPVLSLKLLSVVSHGGGGGGSVRVGFIASAAGIVFSFLLLAGTLIAARAAGVSVGWGIQFQQPIFLAVMTLIVTLFAWNLLGFFEIRLPGRIADLAGGGGPSHSLAGHFATGAFATLLATPCSAPFLGTAIGFALSRGSADILAIFLCLGLGLALPYLTVAAFPALATRLPRPGAWMIWLRRLLALALIATAIWLVSVIWVQIGSDGAISIGVLTALTGAVLWTARLPDSRLGRHAGKIAAVLAVAVIALAARGPDGPSTARADAGWRSFDLAEIDRLTANGKTVFVDVTADWCLTCKVNKQLVLERPPVSDWLARDDVVGMRADWTRPSDAIAAYLASFGRYGIPFNAIYAPKAPKGVALPELLTSGATMAVADRLQKDGAVAKR